MTALSADRPSSNPQDDLFGHAPFAESLAISIDTSVCAQRLMTLQQAGSVPDSARESVNQFLKEFEMLKAGKNPVGVGAFDV